MLYALNEICNGNKHKMLTPIGIVGARPRFNFKALGFMSVPQKPIWDRAKNEIVIMTVGPHTEEFHYDVEFRLNIAFDEIEVVGGYEATAVLNALASEVERILLAIEAESRRLGFVN